MCDIYYVLLLRCLLQSTVTPANHFTLELLQRIFALATLLLSTVCVIYITCYFYAACYNQLPAVTIGSIRKGEGLRQTEQVSGIFRY